MSLLLWPGSELTTNISQAYDAARVYLAKWARVVAEEGERARRAEVVISGPGGRAEDTEVGAFEVLSVRFLHTPHPSISADRSDSQSTYKITRPKSTRASATPIVDTEWAAWFDDHGKLMLTEDEAKKRIFQRVSCYLVLSCELRELIRLETGTCARRSTRRVAFPPQRLPMGLDNRGAKSLAE